MHFYKFSAPYTDGKSEAVKIKTCEKLHTIILPKLRKCQLPKSSKNIITFLNFIFEIHRLMNLKRFIKNIFKLIMKTYIP